LPGLAALRGTASGDPAAYAICLTDMIVDRFILFSLNALALPRHSAYTTSEMNQIVKHLRRTVILGLTSLVFLIAVGATLTLITAHAYAGTCSQLSGFPGLLQRMGFVTTGTCVTKVGGTACSGGSGCDASGSPGTCKNTAAVGKAPVCACVPNTVSQP
jgi:hypothetical protein